MQIFHRYLKIAIFCPAFYTESINKYTSTNNRIFRQLFRFSVLALKHPLCVVQYCNLSITSETVTMCIAADNPGFRTTKQPRPLFIIKLSQFFITCNYSGSLLKQCPGFDARLVSAGTRKKLFDYRHGRRRRDARKFA